MVLLALVLAALVGRSTAAGDEAAPRLQEALELLKAKRYEEAARAFATAGRGVEGGCADCLLGEASARFALRDDKGARRAAEKAAPLLAGKPPALARAHNIVGLSLLREAGHRNERMRDAEAAFRAALAASPDDPTARFNLGSLLLRQSRDEEGVAELRRANGDAGAYRDDLEAVESRRVLEPVGRAAIESKAALCNEHRDFPEAHVGDREPALTFDRAPCAAAQPGPVSGPPHPRMRIEDDHRSASHSSPVGPTMSPP